MRRRAAAASRGSGLGRTQGQSERLQRQRVEVAPWCPAVCEPVGHTVHGILQARILECGAVPFSRGSPQPGIEPASRIAGGFFTS